MADDKKPTEPVKGILDYPTRRTQPMPGLMGMLAQQINQGYSAMPVQGILGHMQQLYSPMDVYDNRPADIRNPPVPGQPVQPKPTVPGVDPNMPDWRKAALDFYMQGGR